MPSPQIHRKTGIYYLRVIVPTDLRDKAKGETITITVAGKERPAKIGTHVKVTLDTKNPAEAKARFAAALADVEAFWQSLRNGPITLSRTRRLALAGEIHRALVHQYEDDPGSASQWQEHVEIWESALNHENPEARTSLLEMFAGDITDAALAKRGLRITKESRAELLEDVATAYRDASLDIEGMALKDYRLSRYPVLDDAGNLRPRGAHARAVVDQEHRAQNLEQLKTAEPLTSESLLADWSAERTPAASTLRSYKGKFRQLKLVLGFDDLRRVTTDHVIQYKEARLKAGTDPGTVADDILNMGAVCKWGASNQKLESNPFAGLAPKPSRRGGASRDGFDDDEAKRILLAARLEDGWRRWLPWLLAFTGARISELVELRRRDVHERDGVMILDIVPHAIRAGKNSIAQRMIPLHPAIIEEGFLSYVASLPNDPNGPLFPSITPDSKGSRVHPAIVQSGRWVRNVVGIKDSRKPPNHAWRHRIQDELRKIRSDPELQDAITGRNNPRNAGAGYGRGFRGMPKEVLKDLERIPSPVSTLPTNPTAGS